MSTKQTEALKLALDWYDSGNENPDDFANMIKQVIALAQQPAQGCDYCNNPQYAGTKCKNCGREQPAQQQEPVAWMKDCADFWEHYTYISEASQENYKAEAQMWVEKLRTSPQPSKPLPFNKEDLAELDNGLVLAYKLGWKSAEEAHGIKE